MKKLLLLSFILLTMFLYGENGQSVIPVDSELYTYLDILTLKSGVTPFFASKPYSVAEVKEYLDALSPEALDGEGRKLYFRVRDELKAKSVVFSEDGVQFAFEAAITGEWYSQQNETVEWIHGFKERKSMAEFPLEFYLLENMYGLLHIPLKESQRMMDYSFTNHFNWISAERHIGELDWNFPLRAFFSFGDTHWNVLFGRDTLSWGDGWTGNLLVSDYADYHNIFQGSVFWSFFKFTLTYLTMEPYIGVVQNENYDPDLYKAFFAHRFDFRLFNIFTFALTESVMYGEKYPDLSNFNPLMIFHNFFIPERSNSLITLEGSANILGFAKIYGQYALDEAAGLYDDGKPHTGGFIIGAEGGGFVGPAYFYGGAEWVKTDPWLYNHGNELTKFSNWRSAYSSIIGPKWVFKPLGYRYGCDANVIGGKVGVLIPGFTDVSVDVIWRQKGERSINDPFLQSDTVHAQSPTGVSEDRLAIGFHGQCTPLQGMDLFFNGYYITMVNQNHTAGASAVDVQLSGGIGVQVIELLSAYF